MHVKSSIHGAALVEITRPNGEVRTYRNVRYSRSAVGARGIYGPPALIFISDDGWFTVEQPSSLRIRVIER